MSYPNYPLWVSRRTSCIACSRPTMIAPAHRARTRKHRIAAPAPQAPTQATSAVMLQKQARRAIFDLPICMRSMKAMMKCWSSNLIRMRRLRRRLGTARGRDRSRAGLRDKER